MDKRKIFPNIFYYLHRKLFAVIRMDKKKSSSVQSEKTHDHVDPISLARSFRKTRDDGIRSDVDGSYTGVTREGDTPIQDVDDL